MNSMSDPVTYNFGSYEDENGHTVWAAGCNHPTCTWVASDGDPDDLEDIANAHVLTHQTGDTP